VRFSFASVFQLSHNPQVNALDILIEDAKMTLEGWGAQSPSFMLCNSKLTIQVRAPSKNQN
jgi:hypothetical protein